MKRRINNIDLEIEGDVVRLQVDDFYPHDEAKANKVIDGYLDLGTQDLDFLIEDLLAVRREIEGKKE